MKANPETPLATYWESPLTGDFRRIYHVSPTVLVAAIDHHGIDPAYANGALKVSYFVEKKALLWAIAHVSAMKSISVDQLSIHAVNAWKGLLIHTNAAHVFTCRFRLHSLRQYDATDAFKWFHPDGTFSNG